MDHRAETAQQEAADGAVETLQLASQLLRQPSNDTVYEKKMVITFMIIPFSIAGVLIRIALQRLETYSGAPVFSLIYAQWVGCFIMGIVTVYKNHLFFVYHSLQVGVATGLCGSITTFSSWQWGIFAAFANVSADDHSVGKNILAAISQFLVTLAMSIHGFRTGRHAGFVLESMQKKYRHWARSKRDQQWQQQTKVCSNGDTVDETVAMPTALPLGTPIANDTKANQHQRRRSSVARIPKLVSLGFSCNHLTVQDWLVIVFGMLSWVAVILVAALSPNQQELSLACVFAPVGALLRWRLSFYNGATKFTPLGTFIANIFGTLVLAVLYLLRYSVPVSPISCLVLNALSDGFCGCLTTISTFVVELTILRHRQAYAYGIVSVVSGQCLMFLIVGPYIWTHGIDLLCGSF
ncbi:hypothetical protein DM01DRAFT_1403974 [Hesseltinella vesiculosa]|uniref:CRCB-domain-containing protein n=1 Tax=Hesseltinella vesiculosa TaxID=101127 RepID=A0A1X2GW75_9FUNG|nr:hypothetical protein DM01DRAFT_1403974 [Hesseltinella vesiculosa]